MAYISNQLSIIANTMAMFGATEGQFALGYYNHASDSLATILGANYISDGQKRGLLVGSVIYVQTTAGIFQCEVSAVQAPASGYGVTLELMSASTGTGVANMNTAIATVGAGTLTAAALVGAIITRSGSTAAFTDTTDTAANIIAAMNSPIIGNSWTVRIVNTTAFTETLAGGTGVTLSGFTVIPANSWFEALITYSAAGAVTMYGYEAGQNVVLPPVKYTTAALTAATLTAAQMAGAAFTVLNNTGGTPGAQTLPAASVIFNAIPNCQIGFGYEFRIVNAGAGTLTFTQDAGTTFTMPTHVSITTNTFVDYFIVFTSATAATIYSVGSGVAP